jgi:hypothetical protein
VIRRSAPRLPPVLVIERLISLKFERRGGEEERRRGGAEERRRGGAAERKN